MLGSNDARPLGWREETFVEEYIVLLRELQGPEPSRVVLVGVPPRAATNSWGVSVSIMEEAVPRGVQRAASALGLPVFNPREKFGSQLHLSDGLHLEDSGHRLLADVVNELLLSTVEH